MQARKFLFLVALIAIVVLAAPVAAQEATPTPTAWTVEKAVELYSITGTYAVSECEYEGNVEPDCWRFTGTIQMTNPHNEWVDGYRRCEGETRPAYAAMQRADRISIPPLYSTTPTCFVEVLVARPEAPEQQTSLEQRGESQIQWTLDEARRFFELEGPDAGIQRHGLQSWEVPEFEGQTWTLTNVCSNWLDGYRVNPGEVRPDFSEHPEREFVSIPPHSYSIEVEMATLRPCDVPQEFTLSPLGDQAVNIRVEPNEASQILSSLQPRTNAVSDGFVIIDEKSWYRVWLNGAHLWVAGWVVNATPVAEQPAPVPAVATPVPSVQNAPSQDWSVSAVRALFGIPAETSLTACPGENACWVVTTVPTSLINNSGCWQDGYTSQEHEVRPGQTDSKVGIPPGFTGTVEAATLRPCS